VQWPAHAGELPEPLFFAEIFTPVTSVIMVGRDEMPRPSDATAFICSIHPRISHLSCFLMAQVPQFALWR